MMIVLVTALNRPGLEGNPSITASINKVTRSVTRPHIVEKQELTLDRSLEALYADVEKQLSKGRLHSLISVSATKLAIKQTRDDVNLVLAEVDVRDISSSRELRLICG
jgi:hypothetical protein